jgi:hypothetical protein
MKGKGGMALMIAIGKKKPGMGSEKPSGPSLGSEDDGEDMEMGSELGAMLQAYEQAKAKGNWAKAAKLFKEAVSSCGSDYEEEED